MSTINQHDLAMLKRQVFDLETKVKEISLAIPSWFSLGDIAKEYNTSRDTMRKYLKANLEPEADFKKIGGKIFIRRDSLFLLRKHYEK